MPHHVRCVVVSVALSVVSTGLAQRERPLDPISKQLQPTKLITYNTAADRDLKLHVFNPEGHLATDRRSAFVIIHGGGWTGGFPWRCYPFADYFREKGMVAITIDYRLLRKPIGTTVFDCVRDGRSAIRYIRRHADQLGIDPEKIVVSGCSAGGHVAAATALFDDVDDPADDVRVSCRPNAMVLYYPVIDTSVDGYGQKKIGETWQQLSPVHHVRPNLPPTIVFHGTGDRVTPYAGAESFHKKMQAAGNICELVSHADGGHGYLIFERPLFDEAMERTEAFLTSHKFLPAR